MELPPIFTAAFFAKVVNSSATLVLPRLRIPARSFTLTLVLPSTLQEAVSVKLIKEISEAFSIGLTHVQALTIEISIVIERKRKRIFLQKLAVKIVSHLV